MNQHMLTNRGFDLYSLTSTCLKFLLAIFLIGCVPMPAGSANDDRCDSSPNSSFALIVT